MKLGQVTEYLPTSPELREVPLLSAAGVWYRFFGEDMGRGEERVFLCIEIGEDTSRDDVEAAWNDAKRWRERLQEAYPKKRGYKHSVLRWLAESESAGVSRQEIARRVNERIAGYLREFVAFQVELRSLKEPLRGLDALEWLSANGRASKQLGFEDADGLLGIMCPGKTEAERREFLTAAMANIESGLPAWAGPDVPVCNDDVRERLRGMGKGQGRRR